MVGCVRECKPVLRTNIKSTLLEVTYASKFPDLLGDSCNCAEQGGYMLSTLWNRHKFAQPTTAHSEFECKDINKLPKKPPDVQKSIGGRFLDLRLNNGGYEAFWLEPTQGFIRVVKRDILLNIICHVLELGYGNSQLCNKLYKEGITDLTSIESSVALAKMQIAQVATLKHQYFSFSFCAICKLFGFSLCSVLVFSKAMLQRPTVGSQVTSCRVYKKMSYCCSPLEPRTFKVCRHNYQSAYSFNLYAHTKHDIHCCKLFRFYKGQSSHTDNYMWLFQESRARGLKVLCYDKDGNTMGRGKHACVDLTGVSPLVELRGNGFTAGQAIMKAEMKKVDKHDKACSENQHVFVPFAFDTFGSLAPEAVRFLDRVRKIVRSNISAPSGHDYVFSRIGFAIQKGVAAQLVARLPTTLM
ncbi:hypothetical protein CTI12_AA140700 [Artemisia annua]|uniref:Uncharacterized protein n=1 Tax=Artemisia annua TaxID=35608 RepID=A0A2U1PL54_ARTAN|nr:hypothetical protein CTI12_AA140700 [Artemisia annua]